MAYQELFKKQQRQQLLADTLAGQAVNPQQRPQGRIAANTGFADGLSQLGLALASRRAGKKAETFGAQATDERQKALAAALGGTPYERAQQAVDAGAEPAIAQAMITPREGYTLKPGETRFDAEGKPIASIAASPDDQSTDDMREYAHAVSQGYKGSFLDYQTALRQAGASSVNVKNEGPIPPGFSVERDAQGNPIRLVPIEGGPAAREADAATAAAEAKRNAEVERGGIVTQDIDRALERMKSGWLPDTGWGAMFAGVPGTDAKAISSLLETVKANIGFDQLNQMRAQSPTGGALGNVTEKELRFLQAVAGNLDQSQDQQTLTDNLNRLWNGMQDVIHGPGNGPARRPLAFQQTEQASYDPPIEGNAPRPGAVIDGYRFKGGDPSKQENWEKQ